MAKNLDALKIQVFGKVQGVFFRAWAKQKALELNLSGWAKNLADGSVEIFIQGKQQNLEKFLVLCLYGSDSSNVLELKVFRAQKIDNLSDFKIF
jgi:acylphosphatase